MMVSTRVFALNACIKAWDPSKNFPHGLGVSPFSFTDIRLHCLNRGESHLFFFFFSILSSSCQLVGKLDFSSIV